MAGAAAGNADCSDPFVLNDFSSGENMILAGWKFEGPEFSFKPQKYQSFVPKDSFWGSSETGSGTISLKLKGQGKLTLDFGNSWGKSGSKVTVSLNGMPKSSAGPYIFSQSVELNFSDGDVLSVAETPSGLIVLNKIIVKCFKSMPAAVFPLGETISGSNKRMQEVEGEWKDAYTELQMDSMEEEREEQELREEEALQRIEEKKLEEEMAAAEREAQKLEADVEEQKVDKAEMLAQSEIQVLEREERAQKIKQALEQQVRQAKTELKREQAATAKARDAEEASAASMEQSLIPWEEKEKDKHQSSDLDLGLSLYCWALMLPFGYEPQLLKAQFTRASGIFGCDESAVFTNSSVLLDTGEAVPFQDEGLTHLLDFSLAVPFGGKWHTALNTDVFNKLWTKLVTLGGYKRHDWCVKADPDTVFFPDRLRIALQANSSRWTTSLPVPSGCGKCKAPGFEQDDCAWHVRFLRQKHSCEEALRLVARPPPEDCGCDACTAEVACSWPPRHDGQITGSASGPAGAVYINNCKFGMHGPIEVLTKQAVTTYVDSLSKCTNLPDDVWGEDKYMDRCLLQLGVTRVNLFSLLNEVACGEEPAPCMTQDVAFHPFKSKDEYFACETASRAFGSAAI